MSRELDQTLLALAEPTRRAVIELLQKQPLCSSDIAAALSTSRPAMSRHLRVLREAGLVDEESLGDDARVRMYQLRPEPFAELRAWVADVEAFWDTQLRAFKVHAEKRKKKLRP